MNKTKIAVDIDGVLSKTTNQFLQYINDTYEKDFKLDEIKTYNMGEIESEVSFSVFDELLKFLENNITILPTYENSSHHLLNLKNNYDLYILTSRRESFKEDTKKWIEKFFDTDLFEEIICLDDTPFNCKSDVCCNYGFNILIEDAPHYAKNSRDKGIKVFLFSQPWNQEINDCNRLKRVGNWDEIAKLL